MSKPKDCHELAKKIEDITRQENMLSVRKEHSPRLYQRLIWTLFALSVLTTACFAGSLRWLVIGPWVFLGLVFLRRPFALKTLDTKIKKLGEEKLECAKELKELVKDQKRFFDSLKKKDQEKKQKTIVEVSSICALWDKLTGGYFYNKNAMICPKCNSHNGLINPAQTIAYYYCPNCGEKVRMGKEKTD